jgi:hypothetical protein
MRTQCVHTTIYMCVILLYSVSSYYYIYRFILYICVLILLFFLIFVLICRSSVSCPIFNIFFNILYFVLICRNSVSCPQINKRRSCGIFNSFKYICFFYIFLTCRSSVSCPQTLVPYLIFFLFF